MKAIRLVVTKVWLPPVVLCYMSFLLSTQYHTFHNGTANILSHSSCHWPTWHLFQILSDLYPNNIKGAVAEMGAMIWVFNLCLCRGSPGERAEGGYGSRPVSSDRFPRPHREAFEESLGKIYQSMYRRATYDDWQTPPHCRLMQHPGFDGGGTGWMAMEQ